MTNKPLREGWQPVKPTAPSGLPSRQIGHQPLKPADNVKPQPPGPVNKL